VRLPGLAAERDAGSGSGANPTAAPIAPDTPSPLRDTRASEPAACFRKISQRAAFQ